MASLCFVMVVLLAQNVFALNEDKHFDCGVCIRSGGTWCHSSETEHCLSMSSDDECPNGDLETLPRINRDEDGDLLQPMTAQRTLYIQDADFRTMTVTYTSTKKRNVTIHFFEKDPKIKVKVGETNCDAVSCTVDILAKPAPDFCAHFDHIDVVLKFEGFTEESTVRYYVPCECDCSKNVEINSVKCNGRGNYTCGICSCESEWSGTRGDQGQECTNVKNDVLVQCSGNGRCVCGNCKCFEDREGSQYFDQDELCADVCMQTMECHTHLKNGTLGIFPHCDNRHNLVVQQRNETLATTEIYDVDTDRKVWVHCLEHRDDCNYDYYAKKVEGQFYVMINSNCNNTTAGLIGVATTGSNVPLILGILGLVAAVAAVGGIMLWKHMNQLPPLPMSDPQYANIGAEDCTGENPLYKPPTSSFKNPTYGKW